MTTMMGNGNDNDDDDDKDDELRQDLVEHERMVAHAQNVLLVHDVLFLVRRHDLSLGHALERHHLLVLVCVCDDRETKTAGAVVGRMMQTTMGMRHARGLCV
jgi:hypothetical protein